MESAHPPEDGRYICYLLQSAVKTNRTYVGITNNWKRRLRQHNGHLKGGARSTRSHRPWKLVGWVEGFRDKSHVLSFEYRMHCRLAPLLASPPSLASIYQSCQAEGTSIRKRLRRVHLLLLLDPFQDLHYHVFSSLEQ